MAFFNLASIVSPSVNQDVINIQPQDSKKSGLEIPEAIIVDKKPGKQDTGYGVKRVCDK